MSELSEELFVFFLTLFRGVCLEDEKNSPAMTCLHELQQSRLHNHSSNGHRVVQLMACSLLVRCAESIILGADYGYMRRGT